MSKKETVREAVSAVPDTSYLAAKAAAGWRVAAIEWERDAPQPSSIQTWTEEIPYGLRVAEDGTTLVENPTEIQNIIAALDLIVDDRPLSQVASELNVRGFLMRNGQPWTPTALFTLLPRMIEMSPRLFTAEKWVHRQRLQRVV